MGYEGIRAVREYIAKLPPKEGLSVEELRENYDARGSQIELPEDVSVVTVHAEGVPGEMIKASNADNSSALLYLHGGYYVIGSPASHRHVAAAFSQATGAAVLLIDYRRAPEHPFPAALEDAISAYRWLVNEDILPSRLAIAGDSAGGGLTVSTLVALRNACHPLPAMGICISPLADLTMTAKTYQTKAETDPVIKVEYAKKMTSMYVGGEDPRDPRLSPVFAQLKGLPPLLIQVGSEETLLDDAVELDQAAKDAGVDCDLEIWQDMIHVWHWYHHMLKEGREAINRVGQYFKEHIK